MPQKRHGFLWEKNVHKILLWELCVLLQTFEYDALDSDDEDGDYDPSDDEEEEEQEQEDDDGDPQPP